MKRSARCDVMQCVAFFVLREPSTLDSFENERHVDVSRQASHRFVVGGKKQEASLLLHPKNFAGWKVTRKLVIAF